MKPWLPWIPLLLAGCPTMPGGGVDGGTDGGGNGPPVRSCDTTFTYHPDQRNTVVSVGGEWNGFDPSKAVMSGPDSAGDFKLTVADLPVGAYGYKIVVGTKPDQMWLLDPKVAETKYIGGVENSLVEVGDCHAPELRFVSRTTAQYVDGADKKGVDPARIRVSLDGNAVAATVNEATGLVTWSVDAASGQKTKHRVIVAAADRAGRVAVDLHVPFWIEDQPFDFRDGALYFAFTDRFRDGNPANNAAIASVDPRANYAGGDFAGITAAIEEGYFEKLGVRSIWISPPYPNPDHFELGADGRNYSGYHGYWPTGGRTLQARFGDVAAVKQMVSTAHQHGLRVIVDGVFNHVHREHPYYVDHHSDGWFNGDGSCVCGGNNCDWDTHRLDCWFMNYLPDVNYESYPALVAMIDDALYWARDLDVDGFRVDAVKHFPDIVVRRLRHRLAAFEGGGSGPFFYTVGETFTGGDDGGRAQIKSYIGPRLLHAQFDFPLYWNILGGFATYGATLRDVEKAAAATDTFFGEAPMSPFLGNHDVPRFITTAAGGLWNDSKEQAWQAPPGSPTSATPYERLRLALAFLYTQPGVPLVYYGDEIGLPGANDPDNRRMMKWSGLSSDEQATLDYARKLGAARVGLLALRRGQRYTMWVDDDLYVYARVSGSDVAVVAINRGDQRGQPVSVPVRPEAPLPDGTTLVDRLGGPSVTVSGGVVSIDLPARSASILAK